MKNYLKKKFIKITSLNLSDVDQNCIRINCVIGAVKNKHEK